MDVDDAPPYVRGAGYRPVRYVRIMFSHEFVECSPWYVHLLALARLQREAEEVHGQGVALELMWATREAAGWRCTFRVTS
jgi:hypothetical protein